MKPRPIDMAIALASENRYDASNENYPETVYSGVLGKVIGVYLGRPVENWSYERISDEFGEVSYYVHEQRNRNLVVTDDDISGTFTFLRALEDYGLTKELTAKEVGQTWLNYLIERTTILWWGGMGNSTEHTAYLRLKSGIEAPASGSGALNGTILAEQIGAQIFIDGWGLVCPGDPSQASEFARQAASVSHDSEAIYGAQVIAAMIAEAFVTKNIEDLIDTALEVIPANCTIRKLIDDLRTWECQESDWRENRLRLQSEYGYDKFRGNCHIVPNHGLIILSLLHGKGDFDQSMRIVNTSGWDTDCNSGNLGSILGVLNGLECFSKQEWRGPVADRLYLPSADGARAISDALREAYAVTNYGRALAGLPPIKPKDGARFHFSMPGSLQGWQADAVAPIHISSVPYKNSHALVLSKTINQEGPARGRSPVFIPVEAKDVVTGYVLVANPTLYSGQTVHVRLASDVAPTKGRLYFTVYGQDDHVDIVYGPHFEIGSHGELALEWKIPDTRGYPLCEIGLELTEGAVILDRMSWSDVPDTAFPPCDGTMWARAWAKSLDRFEFKRDAYEWMNNNHGVGMLTHGGRDWTDYRVEARITPKMATACGIAVRTQGLLRYYALVFGNQGQVRLDKAMVCTTTLAQTSFPWEPYEDYELEVEVRGNEIRAWINGQLKLSAVDTCSPLLAGGFGFIVDSGTMGAGTPRICPA